MARTPKFGENDQGKHERHFSDWKTKGNHWKLQKHEIFERLCLFQSDWPGSFFILFYWDLYIYFKN